MEGIHGRGRGERKREKPKLVLKEEENRPVRVFKLY